MCRWWSGQREEGASEVVEEDVDGGALTPVGCRLKQRFEDALAEHRKTMLEKAGQSSIENAGEAPVEERPGNSNREAYVATCLSSLWPIMMLAVPFCQDAYPTVPPKYRGSLGFGMR